MYAFLFPLQRREKSFIDRLISPVIPLVYLVLWKIVLCLFLLATTILIKLIMI
jgi:hypothetical protein